MKTRPSTAVRLKRLLVGRPLATERMEHERLSKTTALAVLSSDAISSVAYATEQILVVLAVLGAAALSKVIPISAGSSRVDLQACKLEYSIVSPK